MAGIDDLDSVSDQKTPRIYRPISRRYLRYLIENLNDDDSGPSIFAELAERLIHRRKCANIVPATQPSAGGDYGQDGRTQKVLLDSDGRFRLYEAPPVIEERWIFAFGIKPDWRSKLHADAVKIVLNDLRPDRIIFVTNQFINPEHLKIDYERSIEEELKVPCEILDGTWLLSQLYENDYQLAVELLHCPPEQDPELMKMFERIFGLKEEGISEEEALEVENLKARVQYRNRYTEMPEYLVRDLRNIGDILSQYDGTLDEAIKWYEEALPELDKLRLLTEGIELLYAYFVALFKLPDGATKIFGWLPKLIDLVFRAEHRSLYVYISVWLQYLYPTLQDEEEYRKRYYNTLDQFKSLDRESMSRLSLAYLDEVILLLEFVLVHRDNLDRNVYLNRVRSFLEAVAPITPFPLKRIVGMLAVVAPTWNAESDFEDIFELALDLISKQTGSFQKATTLKERAIAHEKAGQLEEAIVINTRAKRLWLNETTSRGFMLVTFVLATWYKRLGYLQAAEYELYEGIYMAISQPKYSHPDLLAGMFIELTSLAFMQGRVLRAYKWLDAYFVICKLHQLEPDSEIVDKYLFHNLPTILMRLYSSNRPLHDKLVKLGETFNTNVLIDHKALFLSNEAEFKIWIDDLSQEGRNVAQELRNKVHLGDMEPLEDWIVYDELGSQQYIQWIIPVPIQEKLEVQIVYSRGKKLDLIAASLASMLQILIVFAKDKLDQLTFADDTMKIVLEIADGGSNDIEVIQNNTKDGFQINVRLVNKFVSDSPDELAELSKSLLAHVSLEMLDALIIDDREELVKIFTPEQFGAVFDRIFAVAPPLVLLNITPFVKTIFGEYDVTRTV